MNQMPRSINTWDKLQYFINYFVERLESGNNAPIRILFYSPWNQASKKVKGYDCRVNMFEVPEAFHVLAETFDLDIKINYVPTLLTLKGVSTPEGATVAAIVNDNPTAIHYELASKG